MHLDLCARCCKPGHWRYDFALKPLLCSHCTGPCCGGFCCQGLPCMLCPANWPQLWCLAPSMLSVCCFAMHPLAWPGQIPAHVSELAPAVWPRAVAVHAHFTTLSLSVIPPFNTLQSAQEWRQHKCYAVVPVPCTSLSTSWSTRTDRLPAVSARAAGVEALW